MKKRISGDKLQNVCKMRCGAETCAFITFAAGEGFTCAKGDASLEAIIRQKLAEGSMNAQGDNCDGNN